MQEPRQSLEPVYESRLPGSLARAKRWLVAHHMTLMAIADTPHSIALGSAIGIFFGFTPLVGLKTLLSIFFAWLTRSNIIAAAIAVTLHDVALPFMPVLFRWEYRIGYWLLSDPHQWPVRLRDIRWSANTWRSWTTFLSIGRPLLLGSVVVSAPVALFAFWITRSVVLRHRRKHQNPEATKSNGNPEA